MSARGREQRRLFERLAAVGCPIDDEELETTEDSNELLISQAEEATILDLGTGRYGVIAYLTLCREKPGEVTLVRFGDIFWESGTWSPSWLELDHRTGLYRLPNGFEFERGSVLNDRVRDGLRLRHGGCVEGFLLGVGFDERVPSMEASGSLLETQITVLDAIGRESRGPVSFRLDRTAPAPAVHGRRYGSLCDPAGIEQQVANERGPQSDVESPLVGKIPGNPDVSNTCARGKRARKRP